MTDPVPTAAPIDPTLADPQMPPADLAIPALPGAPAVPGAPDDGQSPLDVLDQILKDAQSKAQTAVQEKTAEDAAKAEELKQQQRKMDADKVRQQLQGISQVKDSPEYKAGVEQRQEEKEEKESYEEKMDGMAIVQLEHKKI